MRKEILLNKLLLKLNLAEEDIKFLFLAFIAMLYVTCKVVCNPLFFRQVELNTLFLSMPIKLKCSAFLYPAVYMLSDLMVVVSDRKFTITIILFAVICDGFFSFCVSWVSYFDVPANISGVGLVTTNAVDLVVRPMWELYCQGVIASIFTAIFEILFFNMLFKKCKQFVLSTMISVIVTLIFHNFINDYQMLKNEPDVWKIIIHNLTINIVILLIYATIVSLAISLFRYQFDTDRQS